MTALNSGKTDFDKSELVSRCCFSLWLSSELVSDFDTTVAVGSIFSKFVSEILGDNNSFGEVVGSLFYVY